MRHVDARTMVGTRWKEDHLPETCPPPRRLRQALDTVGSEYLDCFQSTFALFADQRRGPLAHVAMGAHLIFPAIDALGAPRLLCSFDQRRDEASQYLGLRCGPAFNPVTPVELVDFADGVPDCYAVADAHETAWQPTFGHQHTSHSFALIVDPPEVVVVDAYTNVTPWGSAEQGAWRLSTDDIRAVIASGVVLRDVQPVPYEEPSAAVTDDLVARAEASRPLFAPYAESLVQAAWLGAGDRMVLDLWQLARSRHLHSTWLARHGVEAGREELDEAWRSLSTRAYVTQRRASRTGPARFDALATDIVSLLEADLAALRRVVGVDLAQRGERSRTPDAVERAVRAALAAVLAVDPVSLAPGCDLRELPGFQSFRLIEVMDAVERDTGAAPDLDRPSLDLFTIQGLVELFTLHPDDGVGRS